MTIDFNSLVLDATARFKDRIAKHRCVRCGDQHEDDYKELVCEICLTSRNGHDYASDAAGDVRRGQAAGLNSLIRRV